MSDAGDAAKIDGRGANRQPDQHSGLAVVLPHILRTFRREPALALTVAYLLVALAGIYYDYAYYQKGFGIPILSLAQIGDYLVAGLQQPVAIVLMLVTFPLCWLMDRLNALSRRRQGRLRTGCGKTLIAVIIRGSPRSIDSWRPSPHRRPSGSGGCPAPARRRGDTHEETQCVIMKSCSWSTRTRASRCPA